jgi:hypothetical protein
LSVEAILPAAIPIVATLVALFGLWKEWKEHKGRRWWVFVLIIILGVLESVEKISLASQARRDRKENAKLSQGIHDQRTEMEREASRAQSSLQFLTDKVIDLQTRVNTEQLSKELRLTRAELEAERTILKGGPRAELSFGIFSSKVREGAPPDTVATVQRLADEVSFDAVITNFSKQAAVRGKLWIRIPPSCQFVSEPTGMTKLVNAEPYERILDFEIIPENSILDPLIALRIAVPRVASFLEVEMRYACETCGPLTARRILHVNLKKSLSLPPVNLAP